MKTLNITFTDAEFKRLKIAREKHSLYTSWRGFIMGKCCKGVKRKND